MSSSSPSKTATIFFAYVSVLSFNHYHDCRLSNELIADMATLYEMPDEAVQWVNHMVKYTVAGGKMNRGLTVLAATKCLAKSYGRDNITPKVSLQSVPCLYPAYLGFNTLSSSCYSLRSAAKPQLWDGASSSCRPFSW
ncbi:hypothetical protein EON65_46190 [archaeon]|nr:MAG: hypothetical protein EON65_46190 [archaeon]